MRAHLQPSVAVRALRDGRRTELLRILTFLADLRTRLRAIRSWAKQAQASGSEARRAAEEAIALHRSTQDWLAGDLPAIQATVGIVNDPLVEAGFERFTDSQTRLAGRLASSTTQRPHLSDLPPRIIAAVDDFPSELAAFRKAIHASLYRGLGDLR